RAAQTRRTEPSPPAKAGQLVPFPRPHATGAPMPGPATVELPIEAAIAPPPAPHPPPLAPPPAPHPPPPAPRPPPKRRGAALTAGALAVIAAVAGAYALGRA